LLSFLTLFPTLFLTADEGYVESARKCHHFRAASIQFALRNTRSAQLARDQRPSGRD